jgi:hypothetical protein
VSSGQGLEFDLGGIHFVFSRQDAKPQRDKNIVFLDITEMFPSINTVITHTIEVFNKWTFQDINA